MDPLICKGVALITGAGSGIGQAIAIEFVKEGCRKLFLVDLSIDKLRETQSLIEEFKTRAEIVLHSADISVAEAVEKMIVKCVQTFGRLDFAMNNAGIAGGGVRTADMSLEMFERNCKINEKGNFLCQKYEIAQMLKQEPLPVFAHEKSQCRGARGSIVNTASISGLIVLRDFSAYTSSKHGVCMMTEQIAREYAPHKIRINSVCPGAVHTPIIAATGLTPQFLEGMSKQAPMNRWILAEEVGAATVFLSSSRASAITGVNLPVDCGATLYHVKS